MNDSAHSGFDQLEQCAQSYTAASLPSPLGKPDQRLVHPLHEPGKPIRGTKVNETETAPLSGAVSLQEHEIDCTVAVMLKMLDGKCKMGSCAKEIMERLYESVEQRPGRLLPPEVRKVIAAARRSPNRELMEEVHRLRVRAECTIPRQVMKTFKARLRREGILPTGEKDNVQ